MSGFQCERNSSQGYIPTNQQMGPMTGPLDHFPLREEFLQSISSDTHYSSNWPANLQNVQPNGQIHQTPIDYGLNNHSNMGYAGQSTGDFVHPSPNVPTQMQSNWQDPRDNIPTHMQLAVNLGQSTAIPTNQSSYYPTNTYPVGQHNQVPIYYGNNTAANVLPDGQATYLTLPYDGNLQTNTPLGWQATPTAVPSSGNPQMYAPLNGQATYVTPPYNGNLQTNTPLIWGATPTAVSSSGNPQMDAPLNWEATPTALPSSGNTQMDAPLNWEATPTAVSSSGNPQTNVLLDGHASPAPGPSSGKGKKKTPTPKKFSPVSTKGKAKHPAVVEDKDIERCAREYDISYAATRILLDYANARLKGIETIEPRDAPSRYIISRFEQVRRTYPEHTTWPYDLPEEKIIRLLPGQQRQDRAPHKSHQGACEKRRQELDDRYKEPRQWEGPPPPKPGETQQDALIDPAIDSIVTASTASSNFEPAKVAANTIATGLTPPRSWNSDAPEVNANNIATGSTSLSNFIPAELAFDNSTTGLTFPADGNLDSAELGNEVIALGSPSRWTFDTPEQIEAFTKMLQDSIQSTDNTASAASFDVGMEGIEGPIQLPQQPPSTAPIQPAGLEPVNYHANVPAAPEDIQMAGSEEPSQFPSQQPTFPPMEQSNADLLDNSNPPPIWDIKQCKDPMWPFTFGPSMLTHARRHAPAETDDNDFDSLFDESEGSPLLPPTPAPGGSNNDDFDSLFDESEEHPSPPPTPTPAESDDNDFDSLFDESEGSPSLPHTPAPTEQESINPPTNSPAVSADSPLGSFEELFDLLTNHGTVPQPEEPAQHLSALPMEQDLTNPFADVNLPAADSNDSSYDSLPPMDDGGFERWLQSLQEGFDMEGLMRDM